MASEIKQIVYEAPRDLKYYNLKFNGLEFQVVTGILYSRKHYILVDITGKECISIYINKNNTLYLSNLKYRSTCSISQSMKRGKSTILMIQSLLKFVMEKEPGYSEIFFYDESTFDCVLPGEGYTIQISLPLHNFIIYGKTWYERHFKAEILDVALKKSMANSLLRLNTTVEKDEVYDRVLLKILTILNSIEYDSYSKFSKIVEQYFKDALDSNKTWMELFRTLFHLTDDGIIGCVLFYHVGEIFNEFTVPPFLRVSMKLTRDIINTYPGKIDYKEDLEPAHVYQVGSSYPSVPYYRESKSIKSKTRRHIEPLQSHISLDTYFNQLKNKRKTRKLKI